METERDFLLQMLLYVDENDQAYYGQGALDGYLDLHTAPELWR